MKSLGFPKFRVVLSFGTLLVFLLSCHIAFGQTNSSSVKGVIKDPQGRSFWRYGNPIRSDD